MNILYVENHAVFAASVKQQFLSRHSVTVAPSLSAARLEVRRGDYQLLLVDYDLDDGKGDDFVRDVRASGSQITIIGVSSHEDGNAALLKAGATAVCSKMNFDQIQTVIDRVCREN